MKRCSEYAELDLFTECEENPLFEKVLWDEFPAENILSNDVTQLDFTLRPGGKRSMVDLSRAQLYVKVQITHTNGNPLANIGSGSTAKRANAQVATINNSLHSMFEDCTVYLNGVEAFSANGLYPYSSYLQDLFDTTEEQKQSFMTAQGWYKDSANSFDQANATLNKGWGKRAQFFGAEAQGLIGTLHSELFNQQRYLVDGVEVKVQLTLGKPKFFLISAMKDSNNKNVEYKIKIKDARMYVPYVHLSEKAMDEIQEGLKKKDAVYPIKRVMTKAIPINTKTIQHNIEKVSTGQLPTKMIVGFVDSAVKQGDISTNPLNFDDHDLEKIELRVNGMPYSKRALTAKFDEQNYAKTYMNLFESLNYIEEGSNTPPITKEDFSGGYSLYAFNLSPSPDSCVFREKGDVSIDLAFKEGTNKDLQMIMMFVYDNCLKIDKDRNFTKDW